MTPLEAVLAFALLVSFVGHVLQARAHDHTLAERDYLRGLYDDTVRQLGIALAQRNALIPQDGTAYWRAVAQLETVTREWAARWDDMARRAGQPGRHIGAGE